MSDLSLSQFTGRMTADAEDLGGGQGVKFRIAVDGYDFSAKAKKTTFVPCVAFGKTADTVRQYAPKGKQIWVSGEYTTREFTYQSGPRQGEKGYDHNFVIRDVGLLGGNPAGGNGGQFSGAPNARSGDEEPAPSGW